MNPTSLPAYQDAPYIRLYYDGKGWTHEPWHDRPARHVCWYPALCLATPPILDVGCGSGHLAGMCRSLGIGYAGGVDFAPHAVAIAQERYPWTRFEVRDAMYLQDVYRKRRYGSVVMLEVLEHAWHDLALLYAVPRGRRVVASVPSFLTPGHVRCFSSREAVRDRYSQWLHIDRMIVERGPTTNNRWYIFAGRRK